MYKKLTSLLILAVITLSLSHINAPSTLAQSDQVSLLQRHDIGTPGLDLVWSPDSSKLVAYDYFESLLVVIDAASGDVIYTFPREEAIQDTAWLPDNNQLLVATNSGVLYLIDIQTGFFLYEMFHPDAIYHVRVSADGQHALTSGGFGAAWVWNIPAGFVEFELDPEESVIRAEWDAERGRIRTFSNDGYLAVWDDESGDHLLTIQQDDWIYGSTWNADGSQIITYGQDRTARLTDFQTGQTLLNLSHDDSVYDADWIADGTQLMTSSSDGLIHIWDLDGIEVQTYPYSAFIILADSTTVVSRNGDSVQLWDLATGNSGDTLTHESNVQTLELGADQALLKTWTLDGIAWLWDLETTEAIWHSDGRVTEPIWNLDNSMMALVTDDGVLEIWSLPSSSLLGRLD